MNGITASCFGRLSRDAEIRFMASGRQLAQFSIAIDDLNKKEDAETEWLRVTLWENGSADEFESEVARLTKGRLVYVEGRLKLYKGDRSSLLTMNAWTVQLISGFTKATDKKAKRDNDMDDLTKAYVKTALKQGKSKRK